MILNWLKIFVYHFKQNKLFSILNILGLSIGIAGIIFSILYRNNELQFDAWNPNKKDIYRVFTDVGRSSGIWDTNPAPFAPVALETVPEIELYSYFFPYYNPILLEYESKKIVVNNSFDADGNIFEAFPFEFIEGNPKTALKEKNSMVLSEALAKEIFGTNQNILGKSVKYDDESYKITGIYRVQGKSSINPKLIHNEILEHLEGFKDEWGTYSYGLVFKLKQGTDKSLVEKKLDDIYLEYRTKVWAKEEGMSVEEYVKIYGQNKVLIQPLEECYMHGISTAFPEGKGNYQLLMIMLGLSILILVLSLVNYINLATANAIRRAKEVGIRKIVGATKGKIVGQFVFETVITVFISVLLSLAIVELVLPYYNNFVNRSLEMQGSLFFVQLILIFVAVVIFAGIFPALYVADFEALKVLKGNFSRSKSGIWLRNGMLVVQFSIATLFIIGSYVVYQQVNFMMNKDLGFQGEQVIRITYRPTDHNKAFEKYTTIKNEILKIKGIEDVSSGAFTLGWGSNTSSSFHYGQKSVQAQNMIVDFGMLEMLQIKKTEGRYLSEKIASDTISNLMVNKRFLELMQIEDPVGKKIRVWNNSDFEIVGVVDDFNLYGLHNDVPPMVFAHFKTAGWTMNSVSVKLSKDNMEKTISDIEKFWQKNVDREYPFTYDFVDKTFARTYQEYVRQKNLFFVLNIIVIAIALFGLFALASYSIQRRMKEIAIKKTLGAETKTLLKNLTKQYIIFCVIGFLIAVFPTYLLLEKWLGNFAFRIDVSWIPFVVGFIFLMILTLIIVLSKAYQATKLDVLKYLKYE